VIRYHCRWLQVKLAAAPRLAQEAPLSDKRTHELGHFANDIQYAMLALLEGGLASTDKWLHGLFQRLRPDGDLLPPVTARTAAAT